MQLASIQTIKSISPHPNADLIELAGVLNYTSIVRKVDNFKVGDKVIFIIPDSVLPDTEWAKPFKSKSSRVKAIKLKNFWSEGIILPLSLINLQKETLINGQDVTNLLGILKFEAPEPKDLSAKGVLPFNIPITDEERYNNLEFIPFSEIVDVTLKKDGKSWSAYAIKKDGEWFTGICGRRLEYKLECSNDYTKFKDYLTSLLDFCKEKDKSLVIRGEICGAGIQSSSHNPDSIGEKNLNLFSVYLYDERRYAGKGEGLYYTNVAKTLGIRTVDMLENDVILTPELIKKYAEDLEKINSKPFEGVVIKLKNGDSFKVLNKFYDQNK